MSEWTYHLQDALTGTWLSRDLQLRDVEIVDVLTGDCSMTATLAPEDAAIAEAITEWATFVYAEKGGNIRAGGIIAVGKPTDDGQVLALDIRGFTAYANGQHYNSKFRLWSADPFDCVREIWTWLQSRGNSDIGLVVDSGPSPKVISDVQPPPRPGRADVTYPVGSPYGAAGTAWPRPPKPKKPARRKPQKRKRRANETQTHWTAYEADYNDRLAAWQDDYQALNKGRLKEWRAWHVRLRWHRDQWVQDYGDREPYKLSWWDQTDCGQELIRLAQEGGFDWRERHTWVDGTKAAVNHRLQLGYPTIGVRHDDIVLDVSTELAVSPEVVRGGDDYANAVTALGAGQGRKMRRDTVTASTGTRLRRQVSVRRKGVKRQKRLHAIANEELSYRKLTRHIFEVCVWDTTGTLGTLRLGDVVPVQVQGVWDTSTTDHKIVGRRYRPDEDDLIYLQLVRAERSPEEPA